MPRLEQKTAVVTGASSGIGKAIAMAFAREGARIVINYKESRDKAEAIVDEISASGGEAMALQADVSDASAVEDMLTAAIGRLGGIDIWVNNAGADILTGPGADLSRYEKLQRLLDVDLKGTINCCWTVVPHMQERGHGAIVNMAWDLAMHGFEGINPQMFAAVKAGVLGYSRSLAKSVGPEIRVNVVAPGWIETAFAEEVMDQDYYDARIREIPAGRFGRPEDVAGSVLFLVSDEASYITGEMIKINGGLS